MISSIKKINTGIVSSCLVGLALSYYAYIVETTKELDDSYEAMCDISEHISCTKAFMSEYGKGFGIIPKSSPLYLPNSVYGLGFYISIAILSISNNYIATVLVLIFGIISNIGSVYLAYILYSLHDICVICISTYFVNAVNLILAIKKYGLIISGSAGIGSKKRKIK